MSLSNKPSEGEPSKEREGEATTKSALQVSTPRTPREPLQQSLPKSGTSRSNQQSNEDTSQQEGNTVPDDAHTSIPGYFYPVLFLCITPLLFMGGEESEN